MTETITGWPPGLLQDDCRALAQWMSSRPDALYRLRELYAEEAEQTTVREMIEGAWLAGYYHDGYTHDSAYAIQEATKCADEFLDVEGMT